MILDFFKEDFSEIIGAYYDEKKIYVCRRLEGKFETAEVNFTAELDGEISEIEQIAEKISMICSKRGWKTSKTGFCLREGTAVTFDTLISNIPQNEIENIVKSWVVAQVGEKCRYAYLRENDEIWMEGISKTSSKEYVAAWKKNSMKLFALTVMPENFSAQINPSEPIDFAKFVAEVIAERKSPNLLTKNLSVWNYIKISVAIAAIFFFAIFGISSKLFYDYNSAAAQIAEIQARLDNKADALAFKEVAESNIAEMKRLNALCAKQPGSYKNFNALVQLGRIADGKTFLRKIKTFANSIELEGITDNPEEIKNYVNRLKNSVSPNIKTGNLSSTDDSTTFTIYIVFPNQTSDK